ncbi:hypothetical protein N9N67_08890 [Bacteriovoracaceae bacterium]|nr:hypothetical protein [Bacteriovoracaceae bacterium]
MNTEISLLFGLLPLIIFVVIDSFFSLKAGLIAAIALSLLECIYTYFTFGELDWISITLFLVIFVAAAVSWNKDSSTAFKASPFFVGVTLSSLLIGSTLFSRPIMLEMFIKYQKILPPQFEHVTTFYNSPKGVELLSNANWILGIFILIHALIVLWSAYKLSNWWWLAIRGIGFYFFAFLSFIIAQLYTFN